MLLHYYSVAYSLPIDDTIVIDDNEENIGLLLTVNGYCYSIQPAVTMTYYGSSIAIIGYYSGIMRPIVPFTIVTFVLTDWWW